MKTNKRIAMSCPDCGNFELPSSQTNIMLCTDTRTYSASAICPKCHVLALVDKLKPEVGDLIWHSTKAKANLWSLPSASTWHERPVPKDWPPITEQDIEDFMHNGGMQGIEDDGMEAA